MPPETFLGFTEEENTYKPVVHNINLLHNFWEQNLPPYAKIAAIYTYIPKKMI